MIRHLNSDFLIIGGGIAGLSTAQRLLQQGALVTVLERGEVGQEASWAGGGILSPLCPWNYPDEVTRLITRGAELFSAWAQELHAATGIDPEYEVSGMLVLPPFDAQTAEQWCAAHSTYPIHQVRATDYNLLAQGDALYLPEVAQVRNPRLLRALRQHVESLGGHIIEKCAVSDIVVENERVQTLTTSSGKFNAQGYVVTAGAWSKEVLGRHALRLDIKPMRGQMLLFKFDVSPLRHIVLQNDLYLIPRRDGHLLIGSTLEDVGFNQRTTREARDMLWQRAQKLLPSLRDMSLVQHWAGLRPASPHNIPTIGRHPQLDNLYLNSGHFRYGVTMAPASAEILSNEITGAKQPFDVTPYQAGWGA
ncbi:glycine oxidase ThiO [Candidatus Nitrotoga sp. AM1P]|uniref:glycine oxidase ThiO n=1 Tax=Candidatus Nitrotoga sp. AM1P TaxID=2559597 RepID=UPI0010B7BDB4|nr:glycine oxidase ThiO [Candidatus Nitrotoga sp. AM1P]BBJ22134.1 putative D-amino acid oxidase [Candidatus Nitrotoga sp. AM1P]